MNKSIRNRAFTIVELLVVIVVIGILAAITIVSYSGIAIRAKVATIQSDLSNSAQQLKVFYVDNGVYPATISTDCSASPTTTTNLCLKPSNGTDFMSTPYVRPSEKSFILTAVNGSLVYHITDDISPTVGAYVAPSLATTDPANWMQIGTQVWAKYNLNTGTMINGSLSQTNNGGTNIVEKYCFNDIESNCTDNGGLYQWAEAMKYATTEGAQGICPAGSHIPSDNDWKKLEMQLGMTQIQADATGWRGVDQGTQLKPNGSSGLNMRLAGYRSITGTFATQGTNSYFWASWDSGANGGFRHFTSASATVSRDVLDKTNGVSVRCIGN